MGTLLLQNSRNDANISVVFFASERTKTLYLRVSKRLPKHRHSASARCKSPRNNSVGGENCREPATLD
jgi:hypothetical protein